MDYQKYLKSGGEKGKKRDWVLDKPKRKVVSNYIVKQALATWRHSSNESDKSDKPEEASILAVADDETI